MYNELNNKSGVTASFLINEVDQPNFCEITRRVVIISPFPASIQSLVIALTIHCYDVLVFHNENDPLLTTLESDVVLIDCTKAVSMQSFKVPINSRTKIMYLVSDLHDPIASKGDTILWPSSADFVLNKIEIIIETLNQNDIHVNSDQLLKYKDIVMDLKRITVHKSGSKVDLTRTEFELFRLLLSNGGGVLTRQQMMERVWGENYFGGSNSIDVHIKSLRQKLGDDPKNPRYITTVRGIGYRIAD